MQQRDRLPRVARNGFCQNQEQKHVTGFARHAHNAHVPYKTGCKADVHQVSGESVTACLPSRLSRVRVPSPAPMYEPSLCRPVRSRLGTTRRREGKQGGGFSMRKKAYSDTLPRFPHCLTKICLCPLHKTISTQSGFHLCNKIDSWLVFLCKTHGVC